MRLEKKKWFLVVAFTICVIVAIISAVNVMTILLAYHKDQSEFDKLNAVVEVQRAKMESMTLVKPGAEAERENDLHTESEINDDIVVLPEYAPLAESNADMYGWIRIEGTSLSYPVMYTPDDPEYYLRRSFTGEKNRNGTPFLDASCTEKCGNCLIYGHNMKNKTMFGILPNYAKESFWKAHPEINFDTLYEHGTYQILSVFSTSVASNTQPGSLYYTYIDLSNEESFNEYVSMVKKLSLYDTGINAGYGDELITLSTCDYRSDEGRFVVVAVKMTNDMLGDTDIIEKTTEDE